MRTPPGGAATTNPPANDGTGGCLFLASTPLHTFFALGLMAGPLSGRPSRLWLIDRPEGMRDDLADAIGASSDWAVDVQRFPPLHGAGAARAALRRFSALTARAVPQTIAVGMDHRLEFHAAVRGWPASRRIYIDDGLYSYLPHQHAQAAWRERLSDWRRSVKYGLPVERPSLVGGSAAVDEAFVLLPGQVHAGLARKPVRPLRPEWFAAPTVRAACAAAAAAAGVDAALCARLALLLLLPHPRFLPAGGELQQRLAALVRREADAGHTVGIKSHPGAALPAHQQLGLPAGMAAELPARLPAEVLAPLLRQTQVVGTVTTALLSLALLGQSLRVYRLPGDAPSAQSFEASAERIYDAAGVAVFDAAFH